MIDAAAFTSVDFEAASAIGGSDGLRNARFDERVQGSIDRHMIDSSGCQRIDDFLRGHGTMAVDQRREHRQPRRSHPQIPVPKQRAGLRFVIVAVMLGDSVSVEIQAGRAVRRFGGHLPHANRS